MIFESEFLPSAFAEDVLAENGRSYEERLASCRMIVSPDDTTPTVVGLLALGKSPQDFLPGAYIQFLKIEGTELPDPVSDEQRMGGALVEMLRRTEEKLRSHNRTAVDIVSQATHLKSTPYPQVALQQILYNAVLHRAYESTNAPVRIYWFSDRIEIISPGGPYGNVTPENFGKPGLPIIATLTLRMCLKPLVSSRHLVAESPARDAKWKKMETHPSNLRLTRRRWPAY